MVTRGQGKVELREGHACRLSQSLGPHPGLPPPGPPNSFGAAKADGAVAAAVPVLSPLLAETGPGATNQKSKLKTLKLSTQ